MESESVFVQPKESEVSLLERASFMDEVARRFKGEYLHITTTGPLPGEAHDCRLSGIIANPLSIVFQMECDNDSETRYTVANPERLIARRNEAGQLASLEIVSLDGSRTKVWLEGRRNRREDVAA
jgi:hypothetical protein